MTPIICHYHYSWHKKNDLVQAVGCNAKEILHRGQDNIWTISTVYDDRTDIEVVLVAHMTKAFPTPEFYIDIFKIIGSTIQPRLNSLIEEFLADKKHAIIYAPEDLGDEALINALKANNFVETENGLCKVPANR